MHGWYGRFGVSFEIEFSPVDKCRSLLQNDSMAKTPEGKSSLFEKFIPMLLIVTVGLAFLVGMLWQKVSYIEKGDSVASLDIDSDKNPPAVASGKLPEDLAEKVVGVAYEVGEAPVANELPVVEEVDINDTDKTLGLSPFDYVLGNRDAEVVLIEYSDLECPFCEKFHPTGKQAVEEYGDKIAWAYRHFPLETIHPRALPGAVASECVGKEAGSEGFWKFIDMVFTDQTKYLTDEGLREAAIASGANGDSFDSCFSSNEFEEKVRDMASRATEIGVTGTPATFVINKSGDVWLVPGAVPFESLKATIDEALGK